MSLSDADQKALMARARQGDEAAFAEVYASIEPGVLGYIRTFTQDEDEAREIAQDTRLYFFQTGMQRYNPEAGRSLLSFVKASARWAAVNYLRKRGERRRVERLLSEFQSRHPELHPAAECADFLAYVHDATTPGTETQAVDAEH
jgi:DNA-directed RNA polymerase specialized sigma24 family protein